MSQEGAQKMKTSELLERAEQEVLWIFQNFTKETGMTLNFLEIHTVSGVDLRFGQTARVKLKINE